MPSALPSRLLYDTTFVAKRAAAGLLSRSERSTRMRDNPGLRAVEQLKWLHQTPRPLSGRLGRVTVRQLEENITNLHATLDFSHLLSAAEILSQKRPLRHESVLLQILLHHVLQWPAKEAAAASRSIDVENPPRHLAANLGKKKDNATAPRTATAHLTDEQLLQLLLCWDRAAALRQSLEILAQPLLRTLVRRAFQRSQRPQEKSVQQDERPAGVSPRQKEAADSQAHINQNYESSNRSLKKGSACGENGYANDRRCKLFNSKEPSSGQRSLVCYRREDAEESKSEKAAADQLREKIQLLVFLGRRLNELLMLEQEEEAAAPLAVTPLVEGQEQVAHSRPASAARTNRNSANASVAARSGAVHGRATGLKSSRPFVEEEREEALFSRPVEEPSAYKEKKVVWRPALQTLAGDEAQEVAAGAATPEYSRIAGATWNLLVHCYDAWRRFCKRFGWKEDQAATFLPDLALSGARALLALLYHLQAVESQVQHFEGREQVAGTNFLSDVKQQPSQLSWHLHSRVMGRKDPFLQLLSLSASPTNTEGRTLGLTEEAARCSERTGLQQSEWNGCSTAAGVRSLKNRQALFCQVHDLQQQAAKLQRQMLQLRLHCLSHSQALVQIPAATYLLRLLHEASAHFRSQQGDRKQLRQRDVLESSSQRQKLPLAEADAGRQQAYKQARGDPIEAEQEGWKRLCVSVERHVQKERIRRSTMTLRLEDVRDCVNAVRLIYWVCPAERARLSFDRMTLNVK